MIIVPETLVGLNKDQLKAKVERNNEYYTHLASKQNKLIRKLLFIMQTHDMKTTTRFMG